MNMSNNGPSLAKVVMPIIKVMNASGMSWSDREECAAAILAIYRHWKGMEDDRKDQDRSNVLGNLSKGKQ